MHSSKVCTIGESYAAHNMFPTRDPECHPSRGGWCLSRSCRVSPHPWHVRSGYGWTRCDAWPLFWRREFPPTRGFLGLEHRAPRQDNSLEALILLQTTARGKRIASLRRQTLIRRVAFRGSAQKENVTGLIAHQHILQRVPFLLATVIFLLVFWILGALDGAFGPLVQKKGAVGAPSASCRANSPANSSAVRAGRRCWLANA